MPAQRKDVPDRCHKLKGKTMKTRSTLPMLIAFLLAFLAFGASKAHAIIIICHPSVGIAIGQTARVNVLNISDRAIIIIGGKFLDENGNLLAEFRGTIEPGKTMSFDLNRDTLMREQNRIQIHSVLETPEPHLRRSAAISLEVFNNADGKTTVFVGNPND
jgi:hypothetical protein